jgi:GH15 family glucan-1,4-alpha-glucosidase
VGCTPAAYAPAQARTIDFAPRFVLHERNFRPTQLHRIVEPIDGTPRVSVSCEPTLGWSKVPPARILGSNHVRYEGYSSPLRLTTDVPLSYLTGQPFTLTERRHLVLAWGAPVEEPLPSLCDRFLTETHRYWQRWVKHCNVPPHYQDAVIRSALTLKMHCFEDTGAIVAAITTSVPESSGSGRTWDYRYCWLRDAYYALGAFRLLGHFEERESFVRYLIDVAGGASDLQLAPLYRIDGRSDLEETVRAEWAGYGGEGPVRTGNAAAAHVQHDVFGEMVLALAPVFLDERFSAERSPSVLSLLERLADKAISVAGTPDTGIWEHRTVPEPRTFSSLMCWAAADRMAQISALHIPSRAARFVAAAARIREEIALRAWSPTLGSYVGTYGGDDLDASLLQAASLRLFPADDPRLRATVSTIRQRLARDGWLLRYEADDGLGRPTVAFVICTFWLVEALAVLGLQEEARVLLERTRVASSPLGLLSEDWDPAGRRAWGNFPQAYSHVGLVHAAFAASPRWSEVL